MVSQLRITVKGRLWNVKARKVGSFYNIFDERVSGCLANDCLWVHWARMEGKSDWKITEQWVPSFNLCRMPLELKNSTKEIPEKFRPTVKNP